MSFVKKLIQKANSRQAVYTMAELGQLVSGYDGQKLRSALKYAVKRGDLVRITRGIYGFDENYSKLMLANKLRTPSYVSLYSVLQLEGVVFQPYESIFLVGQRSEKIEFGGQQFIYRKIKDQILFNTEGIFENEGYVRASLERALCDKIYLDGVEYYDNLRQVDWEEMERLNGVAFGGNRNIEKFIMENKK